VKLDYHILTGVNFNELFFELCNKAYKIEYSKDHVVVSVL
jgi:hypothetical protein